MRRPSRVMSVFRSPPKLPQRSRQPTSAKKRRRLMLPSSIDCSPSRARLPRRVNRGHRATLSGPEDARRPRPSPAIILLPARASFGVAPPPLACFPSFSFFLTSVILLLLVFVIAVVLRFAVRGKTTTNFAARHGSNFAYASSNAYGTAQRSSAGNDKRCACCQTGVAGRRRCCCLGAAPEAASLCSRRSWRWRTISGRGRHTNA